MLWILYFGGIKYTAWASSETWKASQTSVQAAFVCVCIYRWASQVALVVKNPSANGGDVRDAGLIPGSGRSLEKGMTTHSSILAWRIPWIEEPGRHQSLGLKRIGHEWSHWPCTHVLIDKIRHKQNVGPIVFEEVDPDLEFTKRPTSSSHLACHMKCNFLLMVSFCTFLIYLYGLQKNDTLQMMRYLFLFSMTFDIIYRIWAWGFWLGTLL